MGCPADRPIIVSGQCVGCPAGTQLINNKCVNALRSCDGGRVLNTATQRCECPLGTVYDVSLVKCTVCLDRQIYNYQTQRCEYCPASAPILYNGVCSSCPPNTHYDATQQQCLSCPNSFVYNPTTGVCDCPIERPYK